MAAGGTQGDPRWSLLAEARGALVTALKADGVVGVQYTAAFPQDAFAVWLITTTDAERDLLGAEDPRMDEVRAVLLRAGFERAELRDLTTVAQSQETVDRDYEGSWFYALR